MAPTHPSETVLFALARSIRRAGQFNGSMARPAAVVWPDERREWEQLIPLLRQIEPLLVTLGEYRPSDLRGPAIWIRALLARELEGAAWPLDAIPIVYLPGVGRGALRAVEGCSRDLQPVAELQYRGAYWTQANGRDWTVFAFLKSPDGLGLDVARDDATAEAILRSLSMLADTPVTKLRSGRLEAGDFDELLSPDVERDVLRWMNDPKAAQALWSKSQWAAFRSLAKAKLQLDPNADGALVAAERLAGAAAGWNKVWSRFAESPRSYPGVVTLLEQVQPVGLVLEPEHFPKENDKREMDLQASLTALAGVASTDAVAQLRQLDAQHAGRRDWVWAQLGRSPLAHALQHLSVLADVCGKPLGGTTSEQMAESYADAGWRADYAMLASMASVERVVDVEAVKAAVRAVYVPWVEQAAKHLQTLTRKSGYAGEAVKESGKAEPGEFALFVDGLRFDVGCRLGERLVASGLKVSIRRTWSPLPSVTPTGKAAASPIAHLLAGGDPGDFTPYLAGTAEKLTADRFRKLLEANNVKCGTDSGPEAQGSAGWGEFGDLDAAGHDQGWKLARRIDEVLRELVERIERLVAAGWRKVRVVTDHGWLLVPGGVPKSEFPGYLAETRWGRCAALKETTSTGDLLVVDWRWSPSVRVALAPGISCFYAGTEYTHGGLSLQECVLPVLEVAPGVSAPTASIQEVTWNGLRCRVRISGPSTGLRVEVRLKPAAPATRVSKGAKEPDQDGRVSVVIPDDALAGTAAVVVVVAADDTVLAKYPTCIGGED